jgi:hypothetical protein
LSPHKAGREHLEPTEASKGPSRPSLILFFRCSQ